MGFVNPHKIRNCKKCTKDSLCDKCDKLANQNKDFLAILNEMKRQLSNDFADMLPKYITI